MWSSRQGNGSMHLRHIYCKIKQRIHEDDKSHKLIKILHMCGRWKWNTPLMNLSLLYFDNMRTWLNIFFSLSLLPFFSWMLMCPFFWVMLLGHAIFLFFGQPMPHLKDTRERSLNMEFYFVDGWNGMTNLQCRSLAGEVHMIMIKQV